MNAYNPLTYINIGQLYLSNPYLIDAILFFIIFASLGVGVFKKLKQFEGHAKSIGVALGAMLTFAMSVLQINTGFTLGSSQFQILPATILFALFYTLLYTLIKDFSEDAKCAGSISFLITYLVIDGIFEYLILDLRARYPPVDTLLTLLVLVAIILLIMCIVGMFKGNGSDEEDNSTPQPRRSGGNGGNTGGNTGNGGNGGNQGNTGNTGNQPPAGPPQSLLTLVQAFITGVGQLHGTQAQPGVYIQLQTAQAALLAAPNDQAAATAYCNLFAQLAQEINALSNVQRQISNHPQLNALTGQNLQIYLAAVQQFITITNSMYTLWNQFQANYSP